MSLISWGIRQGHVLGLLRAMPDESVHCVVTSPPYWALRAYKTEPQVWEGTGHGSDACRRNGWEHDWEDAGLRVKGGSSQSAFLVGRNLEGHHSGDVNEAARRVIAKSP